ncbi:helix-turn-helix transcriptional regulator [Phaeovibrio sulfidiphilus]|uniref:Helix-turn-helix transcriptional regulator n=1 Tax=Phaeovibrio sulfidiphilus TaxID=1220600 RepID=A0A8J6YUV2_9PROT|nr:metalloregulator ArsR/SmtB family transcription factor [Phaeovibrio sulfidiphilus]MBE1236839.1 helix-turn-helix transcriptional regulator [Phaeovibrio sulfidiphilus]
MAQQPEITGYSRQAASSASCPVPAGPASVHRPQARSHPVAAPSASAAGSRPDRSADQAAPSPESSPLQARLDEALAFLKRLSNPDRLLIACTLVNGERSVGELEECLGIRQPGLSQQIAALRKAGLIAGRREGKQVFYRLADSRVETVMHTMHALFCQDQQPAHGER